MAKPSKPDKNTHRKTSKPTNTERTQPLPKYQKIIDEHLTNWPTDDDNQRAGDK